MQQAIRSARVSIERLAPQLLEPREMVRKHVQLLRDQVCCNDNPTDVGLTWWHQTETDYTELSKLITTLDADEMQFLIATRVAAWEVARGPIV